jgi:hypothetical protein
MVSNVERYLYVLNEHGQFELEDVKASILNTYFECYARFPKNKLDVNEWTSLNTPELFEGERFVIWSW